MSRFEKLFFKLVQGVSDSNFSFDELCLILKHFGFEHRIRGSHFIFYKEGVEEIINLQPLNNNAKPYQVKQVRNLILKYKMGA